MDTRIVIPALVIVAVLIVIAVAFAMRRRRSDQLKRRFGPEYDRALTEQHGDARRAEARVADRERRVEAFPIRALSAVDREAYAMEWAAVQRRFVDDPSAAVGTGGPAGEPHHDGPWLSHDRLRAEGGGYLG